MNLRQKAKYYKRKAEHLEKLTNPKFDFGIVRKEAPIITLKTSQIVENEHLFEWSADVDCYFSKVGRILEKNLINQIINYMDIRTECLDCDRQIMTATIKVVDMRGIK